MESPLANKVTSQPRATSPSAMLPATVSQAPYCRGGVRHATGARIAILLPVLALLLLQQDVAIGRLAHLSEDRCYGALAPFDRVAVAVDENEIGRASCRERG